MSFDYINTDTLPETNVDWYADGERANADNLNRPIKQVAEIINDLVDYVDVLYGLVGDAETLLATLKTVDGDGSGLDADLLDGLDSTDFTRLTGSTGSSVIPYGTSAERDATPVRGYFRFNTTIESAEMWNGVEWGPVGGGATGGGTDAVFYENDQSVSTNYSITTSRNAMSAGPITVESGVTVTIPSGSIWTIV